MLKRCLLAALVCASVMLLPAAALASPAGGPPAPSVVAEESAMDELQPDADAVVRPEIQGVTARHHTRKPRRTNRRLRHRHAPGGHWMLSAAGVLAAAAASEELRQKRRKVKRALMRRLMTVRGGLQA
jgi:hypothetical protein